MHVRRLSLKNKIARTLWGVVWAVLYRPTPVALHAWRRLLLVAFGARIGRPAYLYPSARVWAPWNLRMGRHATLAADVNCYNVDTIALGEFTTVSQNCHLCSASHDYLAPLEPHSAAMPLISAPITLGDRVWVTSDVFVGPGVTIGEGTVVLARSVVIRDLPPWVIAAGQPAAPKRARVLRQTASNT